MTHDTRDVTAIFLPEDTAGRERSDVVTAAIAIADAFTARFNARDLAGMDSLLHFPHLLLSAEKLIVWERPGQMPAAFFDDLTATTGWHHTDYVERRSVLTSVRKVHLFVEYTRNRADGSIISHHRNIWIVTCESGRWGIKQRSY